MEALTMNAIDERPAARELLHNLKAALPQLEGLLESSSNHWGYEDPIYRFYHQSFKVYYLQSATTEITNALRALAPSQQELHEWFLTIVDQGTGKKFEHEHNARWLEHTRPILEAFFHARYFLEMAVRYGRTLVDPPNSLPSGWAAFLYLYNLR
jgi:hypothetical protein